MIKVITGVRRCGKSTFLDMIIEELKDSDVEDKDIIVIKLDKRPYKNIGNVKELEKVIDAKILYACDNFDIKSKLVLNGERKYYLVDLSIYYLFNTDNRINYGPVLENILHNYLISKGYKLSVGKIGNLEVDFIARKSNNDYYYIQVSKNIDDKKTPEIEYKPFYEIRDLYPRYLFLLDIVFNDNVDGIKNVNIAKFIADNEDLS